MHGTRNFTPGGGSRLRKKNKKNLTTYFLFLSPHLILQFYRGDILRKTIFSKVPEGLNILKGVQLFPGVGDLNSNFYRNL